MMAVFWVLVEFTTNLFEGLILFSFFDSFLPQRFTRRAVYRVLPFFQAALIFLLNQFVRNPMASALASIVLGIALAMVFYIGNPAPRILLTIAFYAILMVLELGMLSALNVFIPDFIIHVAEPSIERITAIVTIKPLNFLVLRLIQYFGTRGRQEIRFRKLLPLYSLPVLTILLTLSMELFWTDQPTGPRFVLASASLLALLFANFLLFDLYQRLYREGEAESRVRFLQLQMAHDSERIRQIDEQNQEVRRIAHDMKNLLLPVRYHLLQGDVLGGIEVLDQALERLGERQRTVPVTGQSLIDAFLANKNVDALSMDVRIEVHSRFVQPMRVDPMDLCIVLGNALDNAIEATCRVDGAEARKIRLGLICDLGVVLVSTDNPITHPVHVEGGRVASTKPDQKNHGFGLESIHRIAEKYGGQVTIQTPERRFQLSVLMANRAIEAS
jgi:two-component system sensor histidine kinase AgrC